MPAGLPGSGWAAMTRVLPRTFAMKPAVSALVTARLGQNRWVAHETARPAVASRLMDPENEVADLTSLNGLVLVAVRLSARVR